MPPHRMCALVVAGLASAAGCVDRPISEVTPAQDKVEIKDIPARVNRNVDLLFVIDDSNSMMAEQTSLRMHFPDFIKRLSAVEGGLPDVHIGVISTDVGIGISTLSRTNCGALGDDGHLLTHGCSGLAAGATFLSDVTTSPGVRDRNYSGNLEDVFACMADLGIEGCTAEQPLESMRLALDPARGANPGFLRSDSLLAIVIISDEDDCSTRDRAMFARADAVQSVFFGCTEFGLACDEADLRAPGDKHHCKAKPAPRYLADVDEYVQFLRGLRPDPDSLVVAAITGQDGCVRVGVNSDGSSPVLEQLHVCDDRIPGGAYPTFRTAAFRDAFARQTFVPIGDGNIADALDKVARAIVDGAGNWCIEGELADVGAAPGPQYECSVTEVDAPHTPQETQTVIAACDATHSHTPCWTIAPDPVQCETYPSHAKLAIDRGGAAAPAGTRIHAQCVTQ